MVSEMKASMQVLYEAIEANKVSGYTPKYGKEVVAAYEAGELQNVEDCLYVIAELLSHAVKEGGE